MVPVSRQCSECLIIALLLPEARVFAMSLEGEATLPLHRNESDRCKKGREEVEKCGGEMRGKGSGGEK